MPKLLIEETMFVNVCGLVHQVLECVLSRVGGAPNYNFKFGVSWTTYKGV